MRTPIRILIVEDDPLIVADIRESVTRMGYTVTAVVDSGELAVQNVRDMPPDAVLMDVRLAGELDGVEAAEQIRNLHDVPIIYLTAHSDDDLVTCAKLTEPFGYLLKPFQQHELRITLDMALYKHRMETELKETNRQLEREIAERQQAEARITHLNKVLQAIRNVNQLITQEKDRSTLLQNICKLLVETRGYESAWIAMMGTSGELMLVAHVGVEGVVEGLAQQLRSGKFPECVTMALERVDVVCIPDIKISCKECQGATFCQDNGAMCVPLISGAAVYGVVCVSLVSPFGRYEEEQSLFKEVATDIAFALHDLELEEAHQQAQKTLQESEERFRLFMNHFPGIAFIKDTEGRLLFANDYHKKLYPLEPKDLVGQKLETLWNPDIAKRFAEQDRAVLAENRALEFEESYLDLEGPKHWLTCKFPIFHQQSESMFIGGISLDITKRRQAEETRYLLERVVETIPLGVTVSDKIGKILYTNPAEARMHGYAVEELMGQYVNMLAPPELRQPMPEKTIEQTAYWKRDSFNIRKDGSVFPVQLISTAIKDVNEKFLGLVTTCEDITERKLAEEALQDSEDRYRRITDAVTDYIYTVCVQDGRAVETMHSPTCVAVTGYTTEEFEIDPYLWIQMVHEDDRQPVFDQVEMILSGMSDIPALEHRIVRKDGQIRWVRNTCAPHYDDQGNLISYDGLIQDVTDRKQAEAELQRYREHLEELVQARTAELQQANRQLAREIEERKQMEEELHYLTEVAQAANQAKSEFLANLSHEIRNPMNAILGFSEILRDHLDEVPEYQDYLTGIAHSGQNLLRLINDVLDLSKIEAGRIELHPEAVNLQSLLTELKHTFTLRAGEKGLRLEMWISPGTPDTVLLDGTRLRQILMNLIANAIKFTEKGGVTLSVETGRRPVLEETAHRPVSTMLHFNISDTGFGIAPEDLERIFEPFQQAGSHDQRARGTGLGLAITKRLVELMNGTIAVESVVGQGTTFRVMLSEVAITSSGNVLVEEPQHDIADIQFDDATILLVEDNAPNRDVIRHYLEFYPFRLIEAEHGQEALEKLKDLRPDLILMDIQMPVMDGYETTQHIRVNPDLQAIPVIAITAYVMRGQREEFQAIFNAYLSKPLSKETLIVTLAQFLPHTTGTPDKASARVEVGIETVRETTKTQDYLEATKVYHAHNSPLPQEFLDTLHGDLMPRYDEACAVMAIDEILGFAERLIEVAETWMIPPLQQYGEILLRSARTFNIVQIKRLLDLFADIAAILDNRSNL